MADSPIQAVDSTRLRIHLLGQFAVWLDGAPIPPERWRSRRAGHLLKLLALTPTGRMHRDQLIDALWPDSSLTAAANSFHQALHNARLALGEPGPACLRLEDGLLCLSDPCGQPAWVDARQFTAAAEAAHDPESCQAALALYPGDLLPDDRYEEWTLQPRRALHQQYADLLLRLARALEERQDFPSAIAALSRLLVSDPAGEDAHAALMRVYALSGQRQAALRQYQLLREALARDLAVEPEPATTRLFEAIQAGRFPAQDAAPQLAPAGPRHNLPAQLTSFIGREEDLTRLIDLVRASRLVTVTGAGGVGKTRLALQAAGLLLDSFPGGAWLVALAPLADPDLVPRAAIQALGIPERSAQDPAQTLAESLGSRRLLLVLDNCEHLIDAAAALAGRLLAACPGLHILATSREILAVAGETAFYCPSLSLPGDDSLPALEQSAAARLFAERARAALPGFNLDEASAAPVAQICRRLDGIPLAIELAAARARILSVAQIAARLDDAFHLLTGGSRAALPRHQTLRACIDWSYALLSAQSRLLLQRLSVFAGGWTLEAAEQVCADPAPVDRFSTPGSPHLDTADILDLLGQLADKSLVQFAPALPGEPRYHMLETVRQYARERLAESAMEAALRERHLDYFLALALRAEPHLRARGARDWLDRLERELDNIRTALDTSLRGSITKGLALAAALLWFWWVRGFYLEGTAWLERLLAAQKDRQGGRELDLPEKVARGRALNRLARLVFLGNSRRIRGGGERSTAAWYQESQSIFSALGGDYHLEYALARFNQALDQGDPQMLRECRELFIRLNEPFWQAECDIYLFSLCSPGDEIAAFYAEESLALRQEIGDRDGEGASRYLLGQIAFYHGRLERAAALTREAQACLQKAGNNDQAEMIRETLMVIDMARGDYHEVLHQADLLRSAVSMANNPYLSMSSIFFPAFAAWAMGDYALAERRCADGLACLQDQPETARAPFLYLFARVAISQADLPRALGILKRFLRPEMFGPVSLTRIFCRQAIQALGIVAARQGQMRRAGVLFGAQDTAESWRNRYLSPPERAEFEQALAAARAALGEEAFGAAWEVGRAMTVEELIAFASEGMEDYADGQD